jgi:hypothetical protein
MKPINTLIRRTAIGLSAIAALIVTGYAASQSVELRTNGALTGSCTYSSMTVSPNGGVVVTCAVANGPGTFSISSTVTNLATGASTSGTQVKVTRTGGATGAVDVAVQASGLSGCSVSPTQVSFADGDAASKSLVVTATSNTGACVIAINPNGGSTGTDHVTLNVLDANADVTFSFQSGSSTAAVGTGADSVTVTRTGGTGGAWTVPVTMSGSLAPSGALLAGNVSTASLSFPAGSSSATVSFTPPNTTPASPALPADLVLTLGTPNGPVPSSSQQGILGSTTSHTITLNGPPVGCPSPEAQISQLGSGGTVNVIRGASVLQSTYVLPTTATGFANIALYQTPYTPVSGNMVSEIHISKCKGMTPNQNNGCYIASSSMSQVVKVWQTKFTLKLSTPALIAAAGRCYAPTSQGPWYVNIRVTYDTCSPTWGTCGWQPIWKEQTS